MNKKQGEHFERRTSPWREIVEVVYAGLSEDADRLPADVEPPVVRNERPPINFNR